MLPESGELILKPPIFNFSVPSDHLQSENYISVNNSNLSYMEGLRTYGQNSFYFGTPSPLYSVTP